MPHIHEMYDFTSSAFILHPTEPKICLHFHKKLKMWLQPGGHIELSEDPYEALIHELREEVGLSENEFEILEPAKQPNPRNSKTLPLPFHLNVHPFNDSHRHIDFEYLVRAKTSRLRPEEGESTEIGWYTKDQIRNMHQNGQLHDGTLDICEWIFINILKV